ncbi:MAG: hypothetical protein LIP77_02575 [Planctomycetes bacterium]|nr:hypothetical protein [Planctomycetota bacterium]
MNRRPQALLLVLVVALSGCADMPIIAPPPGEDMPIGHASVVLGPYLTSADGLQPFLRFVSSSRCVAGIQSLETSRKYVNRQGSFSLFHSLAIPELTAASPRRYQLWLDDRDGGAYAIAGLPRSGQATTIAFAGAGVDSGLAEKGRQLRNLVPNAVVFTTPPFPGGAPDRPADWETLFFSPLGDTVALGPLWFVPGAGLPRDLFPENAGEGGYWKRDVGAVRLIGIDARAFSFQSSREAALARLERDLDPAHSHRAWTVVVLSRAAFDARVGDGRILSSLGDILELGGVDLVIGAGEYYLRTRPFASATGAGQTRYISLANRPGDPGGLEPREYVAALSNQPHVARLWADEGELEWQVFAMDGTPLDILTLNSRRNRSEPPLAKRDVILDAQAALTLQKEVLKITRQAARAVTDPARPQLLSLYFANPTTRPFVGEMRWEVPAASGWRIEPEFMPFTLQPGQGAIARFGIVPGSGTTPPRIVASAVDVGSSTEDLVLTRELLYDVYPAPEAVRLDARFRDKPYWRTLPVLTGLETVDGRRATNPTEARLTADRAGLIIAASMAAPGVSSGAFRANNPDQDRDGEVLEDESLEIFIDPDRRGREYYHFAVNPRNVVLDESSRAGVAYNPVWRRVVRFGRVEDTETWDVEMRIPWEALDRAGPPAPGEEWGFQLVRRDFAASREAEGRRSREVPPPPEISQWAQTYGDNIRPGLYGIVRFGDLSGAPEPADAGRGAPAPGMLIRGGGQLPGRLPGSFLPPVPEPPPPDL